MALSFGKVTGRFVAVVADSTSDSDTDPDIVPMQGTVTFTLKAAALLVPDASPAPMTALPAPIMATLDSDGYLSLNDVRSVNLLATDGDYNPTASTYEVTFRLSYGSMSVKYPSFHISVPAGETIDLTTVAPVPASTGVPMTQGVGVRSIESQDGALVFTMTNGSTNRVDLPALEAPSTPVRSVKSLTMEGTELVLTFTDESTDRVDLAAVFPSKPSEGGAIPTPSPGITPTELPDSEARRAVILGDSHSDPAWPQADGVWWWQVAADLSGVTVLDVYAAGGMTTRDALNGWDNQSGGLTTPQIVQAEDSDADLAIMEFGGNDVANGIDATEYRANLTEITQRLMVSGKRVLIMAPPPLFAGAMEDIVTRYAEYRRIDEEVAAACSAYYMDAWGAIGTGPGGSLPSSYDSGDHIHMNSYGQMALGKAVAARVQQVAGVADPYDGVRDVRWFGWETVQGDKNLVLSEPGPQDTLFKGAEAASVTTPAEGTEAVTIYNEFNSAPGAVWEVSYAYRIDSSTGRANITPSIADWPGGFTTEYPQRDRLVGLEGVRRYEVTVAERATDNAVFFLNLPAVAGKLTARVGMLGMRLLKDAPAAPNPAPEVEPEPEPAYLAAASGGKGGPLTDTLSNKLTVGKTSSEYHLRAAHLAGNDPVPLVVHLHGDGYEEYTNMAKGVSTSVAFKYADAAKAAGALFVMPRTPDTSNQTWYDEDSSTAWLVGLLKEITAKYNVDLKRVFFSGYSGGAEEITHNLTPDHHSLWKGGGAMILGGGGAEGLTGFTGEPTEEFKQNFLMHWYYGENDNGQKPSDTSINAVEASAEGVAWYKKAGFTTERTMLPGRDHYTSEVEGPGLLTELIAASNKQYGIK